LIESYLPKEEEMLTKYQSIKLIDLVNLTDFIDLEFLTGLFERDHTMEAFEKLKEE
jgi:hypothetical protein